MELFISSLRKIDFPLSMRAGSQNFPDAVYDGESKFCTSFNTEDRCSAHHLTAESCSKNYSWQKTSRHRYWQRVHAPHIV
jgi:hypothetical protein